MAVPFLTQRTHEPRNEDKQKLLKVMGYLRKHPMKSMRFTQEGEMKLYTWVDASYAVHNDAKSQFGLIISIGNLPDPLNIILIKSKKDVFVATSSTHAEINAASYSRVFLLWALKSMNEWDFPDAGPVTVYEDNISTIIATHDRRRPYSKLSHLNVRYFALKEDIDENRIKMVHCPTEDQLAYDLTKPKGKKVGIINQIEHYKHNKWH